MRSSRSAATTRRAPGDKRRLDIRQGPRRADAGMERVQQPLAVAGPETGRRIGDMPAARGIEQHVGIERFEQLLDRRGGIVAVLPLADRRERSPSPVRAAERACRRLAVDDGGATKVASAAFRSSGSRCRRVINSSRAKPSSWPRASGPRSSRACGGNHRALFERPAIGHRLKSSATLSVCVRFVSGTPQASAAARISAGCGVHQEGEQTTFHRLFRSANRASVRLHCTRCGVPYSHRIRCPPKQVVARKFRGRKRLT